MGGIYDFYKGFCVCPGKDIYLGMRDLDGLEVGSFPVYVYDVHLNPIGYALTKQQYITIWNADLDNRAIGVLSGLIGPFSFTLTLRPGATAPPYVVGDPDLINPGVTFFLINGNGAFIVNSDGSRIKYQ